MLGLQKYYSSFNMLSMKLKGNFLNKIEKQDLWNKKE